MPRDRSRSPRRKERRKSRTPEKKLDKFGRDVSSRPQESSRPSDRYGGGSRGFREEPSSTSSSSSRRRDKSVKEYRREERSSVDNRYQQSQPPPPPPPTQNHYGGGHDGGYPNNQKASGGAGGYDYDYRSGGGGGDGNGSQDSYYDYQPGAVEEAKPEVEDDPVDEETRKMQQLMGIGGFETTKNKKVTDNVGGYAKINRTQRYRQYMNRRGGFNRPLDWVG